MNNISRTSDSRITIDTHNVEPLAFYKLAKRFKVKRTDIINFPNFMTFSVDLPEIAMRLDFYTKGTE